MNIIEIKDKKFKKLISENEILNAVGRIANKINKDFKDEEVIFVSTLNGSFIYAADLVRRITVKNKITFIKLRSYYSDKSSGNVTELIGLSEELENKNVIILDDIIDTGTTIQYLIQEIRKHEPKQVKTAILFVKNIGDKRRLEPDYKGIEIPSLYVVGYGLDYMGYGRNLKELYIEIKEV